MAETRVVLNNDELVRMFREQGGQVWFIINRYGQKVRDKAKELCPVDQGGLRTSITSEMVNEGGPVAYVGSNLKYAIFVHEGTGIYSKTNPRPIVPVNAKALAWPVKNNSGRGNRRYSGGKTAGMVFSKSSKGSPGKPFLTDALKIVIPGGVA